MKKESLSSSMPKLIMAVSLIVCLGALFGVFGYFLTMPFSVNKPPEKLEWKSCDQDFDCAETQADCCDCGSGGKQVGINKKYLKSWEDALKSKCQDVGCIALFNCKEGKAVCENNKCEFREEIENCAKEGEIINYPVGTNKNLSDECCEGLKGLSGYAIENDKCEPLLGGPFLTCMPCGNGKCESINNFNENKCNCPEDCGEEIDTADWQTYRNEEYGFEVKYPKDFTEQKAESDTTLLTIMKTDRGSSYYFGISVIKNYKINQIVSKVVEVKEINIGNHLGYEYFYIEGAGMSEVVLIQLGQNALSIALDGIGTNPDFATDNDRKIYVQNFFNQIFSTFKFISQ